MRSYGFALLIASSSAVALAAVGCGTGADDGASSSTQNASTSSDLQLAQKSVALLNGDNGHCTDCHSAGKDDIKRWGAAFTTVDQCLTSTTMTAQQKVDCLRKDPTDSTSAFSAGRIGLYAAGATGADFEAIFKAAYGATAYQAQFTKFKSGASMPKGGTPITAAEFATLKQWAKAGMPQLDTVMPDAPATGGTCQFSASADFTAHMAQMATDGWGARLAAASTVMAGCGTATDPKQCLTSFPDITSQWGPEGGTGVLRQLRALTFTSDYWVRSSPDGRYTSFGGGPSRIIDHTNPNVTVTVDAPYDPGYFPNNDGFSFAGTDAGGIRVCRQSVLTAAFASSAHHISLTEASCTQMDDTVYQSVGASLDGSIFFMATGDHTNDSGDNDGPLDADFGASSSTQLTPMFNDGTKYVRGTDVNVKIPNEGDQQLSASNTLLITRFGQDAGKAGYNFRIVTPHVGTGATPSVTVDTKLVATACIQGGKPQLSFDERFLAVHQYTDSNANPLHLAANASNIFVVDMKTGKQIQVTNMKAGQHALYPHWRADGWLYFLVRDSNTGKETFVASDAALHAD